MTAAAAELADQPRSATVWFEARGLTKRYGTMLAVDDASLAFHPGEVRGLIGANGAGKSTLVKMLTGQVRPTTGTVLVDGEEVDTSSQGFARSHGIELMPQELTIAPHLSAAENVVLGREPARHSLVDVGAQNRLAEEALERIGVHGIDLAKPAGELSLVQQRLLMAARAVLNGSRLIVLDEPTAAMSSQEVDLLMDMVRALSESAVSCLYVSHRLDEIIELADGVTAMRDGRVIEHLVGDDVRHDRLVELITAAAAPSSAAARPEQRRQTGKEVLGVEHIIGKGLADVSFSVAEGEIVGLAGLASSGVDQLLSMIAGVSKPDSGEIRLDGALMAAGKRRNSAKAGIGYLPGDRTLAALPNHPVRENVTIASIRDYTRAGIASIKQERSKIAPILQNVGFVRSQETTISSLSGGNQQKALFARWMVERLRVLLLDDPTIGVDIGARAEIHAHLREVVATGVGVILYSSDIDELVALADRVLVFDRGQCVARLTQPDVTSDRVVQAMTGGLPSQSNGEPTSAVEAHETEECR